MLKVTILIALAVAGVACQEQPSAEAAPEPYSYGYETDSHAASEQRDPSGKVTGFYTLVDADGRQRRVEYFADESGFHAKVQTNEVGTKSENSADVEVLAAPPTPEQFAPQPLASPVSTVAQPMRTTTSAQYYQQPGYNYIYGNGYGNGYGSGYYQGLGYNNYGYYPSTYGSVLTSQNGYTGQRVGYGAAGNQYAYALGNGNFNNHLPSQYYRSLTTSQVQPVGGVYGTRYATSGYSTVPSQQYSYSSSVQPISGSYSQGLGSSNYIVLKKRETQK